MNAKRTLSRISVFLIALCAATGLFPATGMQADGLPGEPRDVVINVARDTSSYNFTWVSYSGGEQRLEWAKKTSATQTELPADRSFAVATVSPATAEGYVYRARMTGLEDGCEYLYRVGGEGGWSPTYTVSTGASGDGRFTFLFAGDSQIGASGTVEEDGARWNVTLEKAREWFGDRVEFIMCAGDQVDDYVTPLQYEYYTSPALLHSIPQIDAVGNHDNGFSFSYHYTFDEPDENSVTDAGEMGGDYWVAYDGALIMTLNTNDMGTTVHKEFMQRAIAEYTALYGEPNWKIVTFHHAMFSAAAKRMDNSYYRDHLAPVMTELGVDAVLTGHDHAYTRAYMMDSLTADVDTANYVEVAGDPYGSAVDPADGKVFYLTANSSTGSKIYSAFDGEVPYAACKNQDSAPNITKVDVAPDAITFTTYRTLADSTIGDVVDFFAIRRTGAERDECAPFLDVPSVAEFDPEGEIDLLDGVFAYDNADGDLTAEVRTSGTFSRYAESRVTYTVTDSAGNTSRATCLFRPVTVERCLGADAEWRYLDTGEWPFDDFEDPVQLAEWLAADFDDSTWAAGAGPFGVHGEEAGVHEGVAAATKLNLLVPDGMDGEGDVIANYFFRAAFDLSDPENVDLIRGLVRYDDGYDLYINGVKVVTKNTMHADGSVSYCGSLSPSDSTPDAFVVDDPEVIASLGLKEKGNVVAVELFQCSYNSDDVFFGLDYLEAASRIKPLPFTDVEPGKWYYDPVARAYSLGLFSGVSADRFAPTGAFTRAMAWTVIARAAGAKLEQGGPWYEGARKWAIANGVSDGTAPGGVITREQLCVMLYGLAKRPQTPGDLSAFTDAGSASAWARDALVWATASGLIAGRGNGVLDPRAGITRAEACAVIIKYLEIHRIEQ